MNRLEALNALDSYIRMQIDIGDMATSTISRRDQGTVEKRTGNHDHTDKERSGTSPAYVVCKDMSWTTFVYCMYLISLLIALRLYAPKRVLLL